VSKAFIHFILRFLLRLITSRLPREELETSWFL
jgi:hypothetical protein